MEHHFATIWERIADATPNQIALVQHDLRRTWAEFDERAARLAGAFTAAGLGAGSRIGLYLYNAPEYLESFAAAIKIRAVPFNVNYRYVDDELRYLLDDAGAEAIVFHSSLSARMAKAMDAFGHLRLALEVADDDAHLEGTVRYEDAIASAEPAPRIDRPAGDHYLIYTGGTTGAPKGVVTRIGTMVDQILAMLPPLVGYGSPTEPEALIATAEEHATGGRQLASMPAAPLMHNTGFGIGALPALTLGGRVVMIDGHRFDPHQLWDVVERERVAMITIVGDPFARPMLHALDERPGRDLGCVQLIASSGAMFSTETKEALVEHVPSATIIDLIASTEATIGVSLATRGNVPATGTFLPMPGVTVLGEDGAPVVAGSGRPGLLAVPGAFGGYFKDEAKTDAIIHTVGDLRYTVPGDLALLEADGMITLLGRGSAVINTGGEKVFPEEVEEAIKTLAGVEDSLVFGIPDERFGQRVVGVVSMYGQGPNGEELIEQLRGHLAPFKAPRALVVVPSIPRLANGKPDYPAARLLFDQPT